MSSKSKGYPRPKLDSGPVTVERCDTRHAYLVHHNGTGGPCSTDGIVFLWLACAKANAFNGSNSPIAPESIAGDCGLETSSVAKSCENLFLAGFIERMTIKVNKKAKPFYRMA